MYVADMTISGTEFHPGEALEVGVWVQKHYGDVLGNYNLIVYIKKKNAPQYAWERVASLSGRIGVVGSPAYVVIPNVIVPSEPGEYLIGVLDTSCIASNLGNTIHEVLTNTDAIRQFSVTYPPPPGMAQLNIYTYPNDAEIYIDGVWKGTGNVTGYNVPPGMYQIMATKDGYNPTTQMVTAGPGQVIPVELLLEPLPESNTLTTIIIWGGLGLVLVGGMYIIVNRSAREKATKIAQQAWHVGVRAGQAAYSTAGKVYDEASQLYTKARGT